MNTNFSIRRFSAAGIAVLALTVPAHAAETTMPSAADMWRIIQAQQNQIEELMRLVRPAQPTTKSAVPAGPAGPPAPPAVAPSPSSAAEIESLKARVDALDTKVEAAGEMVEEARAAAGAKKDRLHIGGYGEMHYNGGAKDEIDFHRFVLFFGYDFSDRIRFASEFELEHALSGEGKGGEVELEQAYLEFDMPWSQRARGGVMLVPVGILNETHEPTTFFGVERNPVETNIVPTTWWEGGGALTGPLGEGFSYDFLVSSGLKVPTTGSNAFKVRNGRQKVSLAVAKDPAVTGRLKWTGLPGIELGFTGQYQADMTQNSTLVAVPATLFETHADIRRGPWGLRALWARWDLDGTGAEALGRDVQEGWYVEPSYRFDTEIGEFGVFGRYNDWDNEAGNGDNKDTTNKQWDVGLNFWPHPDVVLKADYQIQDLPAGVTPDDRVNLGIGYQF